MLNSKNICFKLLNFKIKNLVKYTLVETLIMNKYAAKWSLLSSKSDANNTDNGRSSHTLNIINNKLYVFGGENEPRIPINNNLLIYNILKKSWQIHETNIQSERHVPTARLGHASCSLGNLLYVFGGRQSVDMAESSLNDLYAFDTESNEWMKVDENESKDFVKPSKRSYHSMCALENKLYIFGGCSVDHGRLNDLFEYDIISNKWTELKKNDQIKPRGGASLNAFRDSEEKCLYLMGGFCGEELNDCWKYDINKNEWSQLSNLPRHLSVFASASSLNEDKKIRLVIHGGEVDPSTLGHNGAGEFSQSTYVFDGQNWSMLEFVENEVRPASRGWHSGVFSNGCFYIYGGNLENNQRTNELWLLKFLN